MAKDEIGLIEPDEIAYRLELTPSELKLTYSALKASFNDYGHDEYDVQRIIRSVLDKLPPPESIDSIDLHLPRRHPQPRAKTRRRPPRASRRCVGGTRGSRGPEG